MEPTKQPEREKTGLQGTWLALITHSGRFLLRTTLSKGIIQSAHREGQTIEAEEAFEFTSQLQMSQEPNPAGPNHPPMVGVAKLNVGYRVDAMLQPAKVYFSLQGVQLYYLDDLSESDAAVYKDLIQGAVRMADSWMQQRVRSSSGIIIPPPAVPPMGRRG